MIRGLLCTAALVAWAGEARGVAAQADTTARDTTARQDTTTRRDSVARDTTAAYLPVFAASRPAGPLAAGTRYSFTADSFALSSIQTLSDLLGRIPGVYVARGGIYGQAEIVFYGGRGAAGLEIYWDGVPYLPLGRDSVFLDPARISLAPHERVDVVVLPATLRVYLITARQRSTVPATQIRIATGEVSTGSYRGYYGKRWRSGLGLSLLADYNNTDGIARSSSTTFNSVDLWLNGEWVPSPRFGVSYQMLSSSWKRNESDVSVTDKFEYRRRDGILRAFAAGRGDGLGPRAEFTFAAATAERDTAVPRRSLSQSMLALSNAWERAHFGITLRVQDDERPWQVEAAAAWRPLGPLLLAADARHARYDGSRRGERAHLAAGLALPLGFSVHGDAAWAKDLQAPTLATDTAQETMDVSGALRWERARATIEVGGGRRDPYTPLGRAAGLKPVAGLTPTRRTRYVTGQAALQPLPGLHLAGWYFHPLITSGSDFEPPHHARASATFYSKFWRIYRSGIFALRGEVAMESWSRGTAGRDSAGSLLALPGATFIEFNVEVQVAGVTIYWIQRNANRMRESYVPGLDYPSQFQSYGVRWLFTN
ncbi:MAG: TonB-dependent receptor [Gemmatimonadales bacterium]